MNLQFDQYKQLGIREIWGSKNQTISSVCYDSRNVTRNSSFVCLTGENKDGHVFMESAIQKGAVVVAGENKTLLKKASKRYGNLTFLHVHDAREFLAALSIVYYQNIHEKLITVGITGTNGKTTVAAYVRSLMNLCGIKSGSIGTTGMITSTGKLNFTQSTPTTPEAPDLHYILQEFVQHGDQLAVMEVTSVGIEQKRAEGIHFDVAIHTNLSPEHLEFHHTFENYKRAKLKLFNQAKKAVVNMDDEGMSEEILRSFKGPLLTYSLERDSGADVIATHLKPLADGTAFTLTIKNKNYFVKVPLYGTYNIANLLSALCTGMHAGISIDQMLQVLPELTGPEGRFEIIHKQNRKIILDYAHTPVALQNLVTEVKTLPYKRLIVLVMGIGIRDKEKMPKMARTIENQADEIVVSVDHPGYNDPREIIGHVMKGFKNPYAANIHTELNRHDAVIKALSLSNEGDTVLLTSGCINGAQIIKGEKIPHSDKDIIAEFFRSKEVVKSRRMIVFSKMKWAAHQERNIL
ncbi:UDP-N-acetylmuramoyl-L-alanyl-D-glutamate--2,6-diaminopimelate ligase [Fictibacillus phosphorivorans]|uniref:UDP-N-acetylmuramoyl-L-alanyl-D-glutamate--2, 6-diaminopimelate ligase n=1 Tax=Fictibacillus phosphorivorans TaxID=1221500 RepID=UPI0009EEAEF9|nr:UDP-N-acetylmuramoyl-L-alanyl-D-glutamate--2,6-diaminopimelate ligase [Fictibacillus phosphorivorans]